MERKKEENAAKSPKWLMSEPLDLHFFFLLFQFSLYHHHHHFKRKEKRKEIQKKSQKRVIINSISEGAGYSLALAYCLLLYSFIHTLI